MRALAQLLSLLVGLTGALADNCRRDACLRAIVGKTFDVAADCSSNLQVTVIPPTSTFTTVVTVPTEVVVYDTVTETFESVETIVASTETIYNEETVTIEETATATEVISTTSTVEVGAKLKARQATESGSSFPTYAYACLNFARYSSACSLLGYLPTTATIGAPSTYVTEYVTSTVTSQVETTISETTVLSVSVTDTTLVTSKVTTSTTDTTTTTSTTAVSFATNVVTNGGFEKSLSGNWVVSRGTGTRSTPGSNSAYALKSGNLINNNLFEMWQNLATVAGQTYTCSYDWKFVNYYATLYNNGNTYVPYVHVYIQWTSTDYQIFSNQQPDADTANQWQSATFTFVARGGDQLYFDCASPQASGTGSGKGTNNVQLDNVVCVASS